MAQKSELLSRYEDTCNYPSTIDDQRFERHLAEYLKALGVQRNIVRLPNGWNVFEHPTLMRYTYDVLDDFAKRTGRGRTVRLAARDALDARAARDALDARA